jgi:hypothetical protein
VNKPTGYDQAEAKSFSGGKPVPPGAYVLEILKAESKKATTGNDMLVLTLDIAKGEYARKFTEISDDRKHDCYLKHRRVTNTEGSLPYFKGDIKAIEESNPGYKFDFDESTLRGNFVGAMLAEEEYEKKDGTIGTSLKIAFLCSVATAESGKLQVPKKKEIDFSSNRKLQTDVPPPIDDSDLPF